MADRLPRSAGIRSSDASRVLATDPIIVLAFPVSNAPIGGIMDLDPHVQKLSALSKALTDVGRTASIRFRVQMANRIFEVLSEIEHRVEQFIVDELGQVRETSSAGDSRNPENPSRLSGVPSDRFRKMTIAQAASIVLKEAGRPLHGKEIERRVKEGGYRSGAEHFQSTLFVAFRRNGGFENIGANTWRLKESKQIAELSNGSPRPQMRHGSPVPTHLR